MEGKRDEVLARRRATRDAQDTKTKPMASNVKPAANIKPSAATGKPGGLRYDTDGRAYLLDSETNHVIYIASASESTESPASSTKFAGLAVETRSTQHDLQHHSVCHPQLFVYEAQLSRAMRAQLPALHERQPFRSIHPLSTKFTITYILTYLLGSASAPHDSA
ncbi:hypothetical protein EV424DRAFT_1344882 [Suillus variegatus]|nr:hypothetical protein EV424DRAFT_1344882 [Suillus variegatus]